MELTARTKQGMALVELAGELADDFAGEVAAHDRAATYLHHHIRTLAERGWLTAPIPEELGGRGVECAHDLFVASSRLARGDAPTAIGANMQVTVVANMVRQYRTAQGPTQERVGQLLAAMAASPRVMAAAVSEAGQDLTRPSTAALPVDDHWVVNGTKIFCTMSPGADVFLTSVQVPDQRGPRYAYAAIPASAPGVTVHDDWDPLGMRTSGSNSVSFTDVRIGADAFMGGFAIGAPAGFAARNLAAGGFHAAASLGVAEQAHGVAMARLSQGVPAATRALVSDNELDLHAARAAMARAGDVIDGFHLDHPGGRFDDDTVLAVFAEVQAAKSVVSAAAMRVVDRALLMSGGAGYRAGSSLARAVGDVRALMFMNPLSTPRTATLLAELALGQSPSLN